MFNNRQAGIDFAAYDLNRERTIEDSLKELEDFILYQRKGLNGRGKALEVSPTSSLAEESSKVLNDSATQHSTSATESVVDSDFTCKNSSPGLLQRDYSLCNKLTIKVPDSSRFFVIKCCRPEHIQISRKNGVWSSTDLGNRRLSCAYRSRYYNARIFLFFSVNGSGCFCGVAEMTTDLRECHNDIWMEKKRFKKVFSVHWLVIRDVPNKCIRHFLNPLNEMKSVIQSRDTQEIPFEIGRSMVKVFDNFSSPS